MAMPCQCNCLRAARSPFRFEHAALGHQWLDAGRTQLGGFLDQPVHSLVGGHPNDQVHLPPRFALHRAVRLDQHLDLAAAHALDHRLEFAALRR